jgi:lipid-A-disaccharide synthase
MTSKTPRIFISAAEPSGDLHAASLIREFRILHPNAIFVGVAGPKMQDAGCVAIDDFTKHAAMLAGALASTIRAARLLSNISHLFSTSEFHAAVLVDSPMLNLPIALRAKSRSIPTLYYIAPQLWAWGRYRVHKVKARIDRMAVILPFEEEFFRNYGLDATYVGHPLIDALQSRQVNVDLVANLQRTGQPGIAILPGSRRHVIRSVLPGQLEVAAAIKRSHPKAAIRISVARPDLKPDIEAGAAAFPRLGATYHENENAEILSGSDLALVASGTATLEVAYYNTPMITMYQGGKLMYHLVARWLLSTKHLSLVNILAVREVIPEFMPYYDSTAPIVRTALELLADPDRLTRMKSDLAAVISAIGAPGASHRTAQILATMVCDH